MSRYSKQFLMAILATAFFAGVAQAQEWQGKTEVSAQVGQAFFDDDAKYDNDDVFGGGRIGYYFTDDVSLEANMFAGNIEAGASKKNTTLYLPGLDFLYHFGDGNVRPFVAAGTVVQAPDGPRDANTTHIAYPLGGGLKWFLTDNFGLRGDVRYVLSTEGGDELQQVFVAGGINYLFGEKPAPAAFAEHQEQLDTTGKASLTLLVEFDLESSKVKPEYMAHLDEVAAFIIKNDATNVEIAGHTDSTGTDSYNQSLSERRASAVADYLVGKGVLPSRLVAAGYGESEPIAENDTAEGRQQNRRTVANVVAITK